MALYLKENLTFDRAKIEVITEDSNTGQGKDLYMKGIFIEGGVKNANERVYPIHEIEKAVSSINEQIKEGHSVLGEVDHPVCGWTDHAATVNLKSFQHQWEN
jgi:hypothetical protein